MMEARGRVDWTPPPEFDPVAMARWLGASIAVLSTPAPLFCYLSTNSESVGHDLELPIEVTVMGRFDSAEPRAPGPAVMSHVCTRLVRASEPLTAREHIHHAMVAYQLESSTAAGKPWVRRPSVREDPPPEIAARLRPDLPPIDGWTQQRVTVDGEPDRWPCLASRDVVTDEEIIGCGALLPDVLVAVVGPTALLDQIVLNLIHPSSAAEEEHPT